MTPNLEPRPTKFVEPRTGELTLAAQNYFDLVLEPRLVASSRVVNRSQIPPGQSAAIGTTSLVPIAGGSYRVAIYGQLMQAASVSSSLNVTITSTYNGQTITQSLAAVTGNTLTTVLMGTVNVRADAGSLISYTVAYASVGGTVMKFDIYLSAEAI